MTTPPPTTLITGASGQDGYYLTAALADRGWTVHAVYGPHTALTPDGYPVHPLTNTPVTQPNIHTHVLDLTDAEATRSLVTDTTPDYIFHLAAQSSVAASWKDPVATTQVNALTAITLMDAAHHLTGQGHPVHFTNASSAEIFAGITIAPQTETTPLTPRSPYGCAKTLAHTMAHAYRAQGLSITNAILYPHESPLRPAIFVTRKITQAAARIAAGLQKTLTLGDLSTRRDWGWAPDYAHALILIADSAASTDYIIATGRTHSIEDVVDTAFTHVGIPDWHRFVTTDPAYSRPVNATDLTGDHSKISEELGWQPSTPFETIITAMTDNDIALVENS